MKVLLIIDQCNPEGYSVPLVGYRFFEALDQIADVTLVTSDRHKDKLEARGYRGKVVYISPHVFLRSLSSLVAKMTARGLGNWNWPLRHMLSYPEYLSFDNKVYHQFKEDVENGKFDVVHALPPIIPRYPVRISCCEGRTPFILGPVNGGFPFPKGFQEKAKQENQRVGLLKKLLHLWPRYLDTYRKADRILVGSSYTLKELQQQLKLDPSKLSLFFENGIKPLENEVITRKKKEKITVLYVGRLVTCKGVDYLLEAVARLPGSILEKIKVKIVGDGPEKQDLMQLAKKLEISQLVKFLGWVAHERIQDVYQTADLFCFPSVREFGGGVVMEAMQSGLPLVIADYGGMAEYVSDKAGFKVPVTSESALIQGLADKISLLSTHPELREEMGFAAKRESSQFTWAQKGRDLLEIYQSVKGAL